MKLLRILLIMLLPVLLSAQKWEAGFFVGGVNYQGDLVVPSLTLKELKFAYGGHIRHHFSNKLALRASLMFGELGGDDKNFDDPAWRQDRAFNFTTPLTEVSGVLEWNILGKDRYSDEGKFMDKIYTPYLFAGIGAVFVKPDVDFNEANMDGKMLKKILLDKAESTPTSFAAFPFGAGVRLDLSESAVFGLEASLRPPVTDYLDGISEAANPDRNDWYSSLTASISWRFGEISGSTPEEIIEAVPEVLDTDMDGIADDVDACPDEAGVALFKGCPDSDSDGVADKNDDCPDVAGRKTLNGCPDSDNDGIADKDDDCPEKAGVASNKGCPAVVAKVVDTDNDGVIDEKDECPNTAGTLLGCPDKDRDGIADKSDACPNNAGLSVHGGCPDTDGDGIIDSKDRCPNTAGVGTVSGCPEIKTEERAVLTSAMRSIRFESGNNILKSESYNVLTQIVGLMNKYPQYSLRIKGHTDSQGSSSTNQALSEKRARACYDFLVSKGISPSRMNHSGYGETQPIASNQTSAGRLENRRVEFELY